MSEYIESAADMLRGRIEQFRAKIESAELTIEQQVSIIAYNKKRIREFSAALEKLEQ